MQKEKKPRKLIGIIVSHSGDKTIKVVTDYKVKHPKYGKYVRRRTKIAVHDTDNIGQVGDCVEVCECRPMSKTKSWALVKILKKAI